MFGQQARGMGQAKVPGLMQQLLQPQADAMPTRCQQGWEAIPDKKDDPKNFL